MTSEQELKLQLLAMCRGNAREAEEAFDWLNRPSTDRSLPVRGDGLALPAAQRDRAEFASGFMDGLDGCGMTGANENYERGNILGMELRDLRKFNETRPVAQEEFEKGLADGLEGWNYAKSKSAKAHAGLALGHELRFLIDRLADFVNTGDNKTEEGEREWHGHVAPSIARLGKLLLELPREAAGRTEPAPQEERGEQKKDLISAESAIADEPSDDAHSPVIPEREAILGGAAEFVDLKNGIPAEPMQAIVEFLYTDGSVSMATTCDLLLKELISESVVGYYRLGVMKHFWQRGANDRCKGVEISACPFAEGSLAAIKWRAGWQGEEDPSSKASDQPASSQSTAQDNTPPEGLDDLRGEVFAETSNAEAGEKDALAPDSDNCGKCWDCLEGVRDGNGYFFKRDTMFVVCALCGNKRCPHGTNHHNDCTGSNDTGQRGSRYGGLEAEAPAPDERPRSDAEGEHGSAARETNNSLRTFLNQTEAAIEQRSSDLDQDDPMRKAGNPEEFRADKLEPVDA